MGIAMTGARKQYELKIQVKLINTAMSILFTKIDNIGKSGVFDNDNRRKPTSLFKELLKSNWLCQYLSFLNISFDRFCTLEKLVVTGCILLTLKLSHLILHPYDIN